MSPGIPRATGHSVKIWFVVGWGATKGTFRNSNDIPPSQFIERLSQ